MLADIHHKYKTDKGTDHSYIATYDTLFAPMQDKPIKLLEVGVLYGESLKLFGEYFTHPSSSIIGLDNFSQAGGADEVKSKLAAYSNIHIIKANSMQISPTDLAPAPPPYDIVIDDGDHTVNGQVQTFTQLYPHLTPNTGIYIIEDIGGYHAASQIETTIKSRYSNVIIDVKHFYKNGRADDVLMVIKQA